MIENTHGSEAQELIDRWRKRADNVNLPRCVVDALDDCATDLEMHLLRQEPPTTPPPLAGEGGEIEVDTLDGGTVCVDFDTGTSEVQVSVGFTIDGEAWCAAYINGRRFTGRIAAPKFVEAIRNSAPPTLAPSQGTAVTETLAILKRLENVMRTSQMSDEDRDDAQSVLTELHAALASPAVRDERMSDEMLGELLAVIHRDGGHYQSEHGLHKAVADAIEKVTPLIQAEDRTHQNVAAAVDEPPAYAKRRQELFELWLGWPLEELREIRDRITEPLDWSLVATPASILAAEDGGTTYSPPDWADLRKSFVSMMAKIDLRFRSGNSIKADRAHITAEEWALMGRYEEACEDLITTVLSSANSQAGVRRIEYADVIAIKRSLERKGYDTRIHLREALLGTLQEVFPNGVAQGDSHGR